MDRRTALPFILVAPFVCAGGSLVGIAGMKTAIDHVTQTLIAGGQTPFLLEDKIAREITRNYAWDTLQARTLNAERFRQAVPEVEVIPLDVFQSLAQQQSEIFGKPYTFIAERPELYLATLSYPDRRIIINGQHAAFFNDPNQPTAKDNIQVLSQTQINNALTYLMLHYDTRLAGTFNQFPEPLPVPVNETKSNYPQIFAQSGLNLFLESPDGGRFVAEGFMAGVGEKASRIAADYIGLKIPLPRTFLSDAANLIDKLMEKLPITLAELMMYSANGLSLEEFSHILLKKYKKAYGNESNLVNGMNPEPWATQVLFIPSYLQQGLVNAKESLEMMDWLLTPSPRRNPQPNSRPMMTQRLNQIQDQFSQFSPSTLSLEDIDYQIAPQQSWLSGYLSRRFRRTA
ncbi:hypothetical protein HY357_00675 [Candidatus Roizmanbacteria bacterium]|nr:hypothetical protein [Candidatus Roizmanbacteria bacterium]